MKGAANKCGLAGLCPAKSHSQKSMLSILRCIISLGLLCNLLACQATSTAQNMDQQTTNPVAASTTAALIESPVIPTPQQVLAGLTGQVVAASDVSGQPDTALPSQMVLAIPVGKAVGLLGHNRPQLSDTDLRFLKANLAQADPAITVSLSDAAGNYTLPLDPGEYILCVADSQSTPPSFPAITRGCGRTSVPPGQLRHVDVSSGFGEIVLVES